MTEEEAKTKWCPFARLTDTIDNTAGDENVGITAINRDMTIAETAEACKTHPDNMNPPAARCIASDCMAWRRIVSHYKPAPTGGMDLIEGTGYCGLAGAP